MGVLRQVIDSHIHLDNWFDPNGKDYISLLDQVQKNTGIEGLCIASLGDKLTGGPDINVMAALYKQHNPTAYAYGALVYPEYPAKRDFPAGMDPLTQYRELMDIGFDGIKFLYAPDVQKEVVLPLNDPAFEPFFAQMEKDGTPILWHVADPPADWHGSERRPHRYNETHPTFEALFQQVFDVLKKHPKLHVTFAHFLFLEEQPERLEEIFDTYENVSADLTPGTMFWEFDKKRDFFRPFLEKHADRLIFGSDAFVPGNSDSEKLIMDVYRLLATDERVCVWGFEMEGLGLSDTACQKILYQSFLDRNPSPRKVDAQALKSYWKKYAPFIFNEGNKAQIAAFLEE